MAKIVRTNSSGVPTTILEQGIVDATLSPNSENAVQNKAIYNALAEKADADGLNADLIAGGVSANNVSVGTNNAPYNYRAIPSVSGAKYTKSDIVGGSIAWNQLVQNGDFSDGANGWLEHNSSISVTDNVATVSPYTESYVNNFGIQKGYMNFDSTHKYLVLCEVKKTSDSAIITMRTRYPARSNVIYLTTTYSKFNAVIVPEDHFSLLLFQCNATAQSNVDFKNCMAIDLTLMFGTTIADYVYSLEQATAGSGIAWLKSYGFLQKAYYDYDIGSLQSVNVASRGVVGFNQWDEEWELGTISSTTGENEENPSYIRSTNYIPVIPDATYYFKTSVQLRIIYYDSGKNFVGIINGNNSTAVIPPSVHYLRFYPNNTSYGTTYNNDICINISDNTKNGTYEPYRKHTYPLDHTKELRGIPKLDSNNQLYYDGDVYESSGEITRKYGVVDLGTLTWSYNSSGNRFVTGGISSAVKPPASDSALANIVATNLLSLSLNGLKASEADKLIAIGDTSIISVRYTASGTDATAFTTAMSGVYLIYELATPTTETADPFTDAQTYEPNGTEEFVDYPESQSTRDVAIPCGHTTAYYGAGGVIEIPTPPSSDGNYYLSCKVASGTVTYSWEVMSS